MKLSTFFTWAGLLTMAIVASFFTPNISMATDGGLLPFMGIGLITIGATALTLVEWAKRLDPDGRVDKVVELLSQTNEILMDLLFKEGNLPTGERVTIRTGLPSVYWRLLNQGIPGSKSRTAQADEACGMLEAWSEVDVDLAKLSKDLAAFRLSEAQPFIEAMNQEMAGTVIYGSAANPEEFVGLATRYSDKSAVNAQNIIDAGGTGSDNTSIYLVVAGENTVYGVFPQGSQAGVIHEDLGVVTVETTAGIAGNRMRAYQDHWQWKAGLVVKDWRYAVRICNIDISDLTAESNTADITKLLIRAINRIPSFNMGRPAFYCNRTVREMLMIQAMNKSQNVLKVEEGVSQFGTPMTTMKFLGIPIRLVDQITEAEARVT